VSSSITLSSILALAPELALLILAAFVLLYDRALKPENRRNLALIGAWGTFVVLLGVVGLWLFFSEPGPEPIILWGGMFRHDLVTLVFRVMFLLALISS